MEDIKKLEEMVKNILVFALIWSVGASTDYDGRIKFNEKLRTLLAQKGFNLLPKSYYEYYFDEKSK